MASAHTRVQLAGARLVQFVQIADDTWAFRQSPGQMRYTPFGETAEQSGATSLFGFTGEPQGDLNDLVYLRARYYNPALGRFLTQD
jgi:hypothetical protein